MPWPHSVVPGVSFGTARATSQKYPQSWKAKRKSVSWINDQVKSHQIQAFYELLKIIYQVNRTEISGQKAGPSNLRRSV